MPNEEKKGNPLFANTTKKKPEPPLPIDSEADVDEEDIAATAPSAEELPSAGVRHRQKLKVPFEKAYTRKTVYFDKLLLKKFRALCDRHGLTETKAINEAVLDLLRKYDTDK